MKIKTNHFLISDHFFTVNDAKVASEKYINDFSITKIIEDLEMWVSYYRRNRRGDDSRLELKYNIWFSGYENDKYIHNLASKILNKTEDTVSFFTFREHYLYNSELVLNLEENLAKIKTHFGSHYVYNDHFAYVHESCKNLHSLLKKYDSVLKECLEVIILKFRFSDLSRSDVVNSLLENIVEKHQLADLQNNGRKFISNIDDRVELNGDIFDWQISFDVRKREISVYGKDGEWKFNFSPIVYGEINYQRYEYSNRSDFEFRHYKQSRENIFVHDAITQRNLKNLLQSFSKTFESYILDCLPDCNKWTCKHPSYECNDWLSIVGLYTLNEVPENLKCEPHDLALDDYQVNFVLLTLRIWNGKDLSIYCHLGEGHKNNFLYGSRDSVFHLRLMLDGVDSLYCVQDISTYEAKTMSFEDFDILKMNKIELFQYLQTRILDCVNV